MVYDVIIIGGGPAGGWASQKAKEAGLEPLLVEKRYLGGVCLNEGCIPSKALLYCAKRYSHARESAAYGVTAEKVTFDLKTAMARKEKIIATIRKGTESTKKRMKIPVIFAQATILPRENGLFNVKAGNETCQGKRVLVCTGSEAIRPPVPGADQDFVMTNREILSIDFVPRRLVIVGGGVIGLEFATFFAEIGSAVTVIEMLPDIAGALDTDIRKVLKRELEKKGITFKLNTRVVSIGKNTVACRAENGSEENLDADVVLMSVGRRPVISGFGLENIHVACERGAITVDERGRTNVPGIWAAGDVNGVSMLAHTASREVEVCIDDMIGRRSAIRYENIPAVIYTHPEVASVGLTLDQAKGRGYDAVEYMVPLSYNGRYLAETDGGRGQCKAVVERRHGTILGVHMIGGECSEMIHAAVVMIENELRITDVKEIVFAHPTVTEIIKDTIADIKP